MKTALLLIVAALLCGQLSAQDYSQPIRIINGQRISIQPLLAWWKTTEALVASNRVAKPADRQPLPPRVFPGWARITSTEMTNDGHMMIVRARILHSPNEMWPTNETVALRHAPIETKKKHDATIAALKETEGQQANAASRAETARANANFYSDRANQYGEMTSYTGSHGLANAAAANSQAAANEHRRAEVASAQGAALGNRAEQLRQQTDGGRPFTLDDFALRTTEKYKGMTIFELGHPFGK
jgi:hypothetical protein